jgi:signal recognition particle GTPase
MNLVYVGWKQVAYWLVQHDVSVMMAACDTFRSGAVEQLRTHARRLQVDYSLLVESSLIKKLCGSDRLGLQT